MFKRRRDRRGDHQSTEPRDLPSPGWQAIDDAMARLYGEAVPRHVGYMPPAAFSKNLQGCSAFHAGDHWHFVTYGLSELYLPAPEDDPSISGWGFELTMRVPRAAPAEPEWSFTMLNELAKHVNGNGVLLQPGDRVDLRVPVTGYPNLPDAPDTGLTIYAITIDPQLGKIQTPNGRVRFLQVVGVTAAEKDRMLDTSTADVLADMAASNALLLTDPSRA